MRNISQAMNLLVVLVICSVVGARCERVCPTARVLYPDRVVQPICEPGISELDVLQ